MAILQYARSSYGQQRLAKLTIPNASKEPFVFSVIC
jgi:hypothetical protein